MRPASPRGKAPEAEKGGVRPFGRAPPFSFSSFFKWEALGSETGPSSAARSLSRAVLPDAGGLRCTSRGDSAAGARAVREDAVAAPRAVRQDPVLLDRPGAVVDGHGVRGLR